MIQQFCGIVLQFIVILQVILDAGVECALYGCIFRIEIFKQFADFGNDGFLVCFPYFAPYNVGNLGHQYGMRIAHAPFEPRQDFANGT